MSAVGPGAPLPALLRGHLPARGVWFPPPVTPSQQAAILTLWRPGCELFSALDGLLLRWPGERRLPTATASGLLLVEKNAGLTAVSGAVPGAMVTLLWQGAVHSIPIAALRAVDPSAWIDLSPFSLVPVQPLGPLPAPAPAPPGFDARIALRRPPSPREAAALAAALARPGGEPSAIAKLLAGFGATLLRMGQAGTPAVNAPGKPGKPGNVSPGTALAKPTGPGWLERMARSLAAPLLGPLLGGAHGRYLGKLFQMFDAGNLEEALRHAIPLGGGLGPDLGPSWSLLKPRSGLGLGPLQAGASTAIGVGTDVFAELRKLYERALEKLLAENRIDDAVFVLVELLREYARAAELLEKHGRYALAAEIAEAGELPPEIGIRLWLRANEPERAVLLARRTGSFAAAVAALKGPHPDLSLALRRAWVQHLADRGDYAAACEMAWEELSLRPWAVRWLDAALAAGGPGGARLIAYLLRGTPELYAAARVRIDGLLGEPGYDAVRLRVAASQGLLAVSTDEARVLLRPLLRALIADQHRLPELVDSALVHNIRDRLNEPALSADVPGARMASGRLFARTDALRVRVAAGDRGNVPVHDLAWSEETGLLVACGELGARLYARDGRVRARFDEPAHRLVPSDGGGLAISVTPRAWGLRLSRLDLHAGTVARWHDAKYSAWADSCDGSLWFVAEGDSLLGIDVLAPTTRTLWRVNRLPGPVRAAIARDATRMSALVESPDPERWLHTLPAIRLIERRASPKADADVVEWIEPNADLVRVGPAIQLKGAGVLRWQTVGPRAEAPTVSSLALPVVRPGLRPAAGAQLAPAGGNPLLRVATLVDALGAVVVLWAGDTPVLVVELEGAGLRSPPAIRLGHTTLSIGDDLGRAQVFELHTGSLRRDLRVG